MCWREEIEERMQRRGDLTQEELEGDRPDWSGSFLDWKQAEKNRKELDG